jgi:alkylation response protein AidB-like acyl-CoA dehydrogenase
MLFDLNDDQKAIREAVESVLRDKLDDRTALKLFDRGTLDRTLWQDLMGLGLGSIMSPPEQGGLGLDFLTLAIVMESLARFAAPGPVCHNALTSWLLRVSGNVSLSEQWGEKLARGEAIASFALLEGTGGWLPDSWSLAESMGVATKRSVEWASDADLLIVGLAGGRLGAVESRAAGVQVTAVESLDRSRPLADVHFDNADILPLGDESLAARIVDALLILCAADACGAATKAYEMAVDYAKVRSQFGRPIGSFQAVKHQLANLAVDIEPCRFLYWYAAHAWDALPNESRRAAAVAKAHLTEVAVKVARAAVELHGGIGYTWEYPLHIFLKRAMSCRAAMGLPAIHQERAAVLAGW